MPSGTCAWGTIMSGRGIAVEAAVADVADDADDLARGLVKLRADAFADDDLLADGIFLWASISSPWPR